MVARYPFVHYLQILRWRARKEFDVLWFNSFYCPGLDRWAFDGLERAVRFPSFFVWWGNCWWMALGLSWEFLAFFIPNSTFKKISLIKLYFDSLTELTDWQYLHFSHQLLIRGCNTSLQILFSKLQRNFEFEVSFRSDDFLKSPKCMLLVELFPATSN